MFFNKILSERMMNAHCSLVLVFHLKSMID